MLVTTAALVRPGLGDQGPGAPYNAEAKFYDVYTADIDPEPRLGISHIAYDRDHTLAEDQNAFFPLTRLKEAQTDGMVGSLADIFIGVPTNRSQRTTLEKDAPDALSAAHACGADLALFVPNCPVCHQSVSLIARYFEAAELATIIMGCAKDIVEHCGVPRFLFSDFPLGNSAGKPHDPESQRATLNLALDLLTAARAPRTTWISPQTWAVDESWKEDYASIDKLSLEEIEARRAEFRRQKETARALRQ